MITMNNDDAYEVTFTSRPYGRLAVAHHNEAAHSYSLEFTPNSVESEIALRILGNLGDLPLITCLHLVEAIEAQMDVEGY